MATKPAHCSFHQVEHLILLSEENAVATRHITRLYRDEFLSEPTQPIWSSVLEVGEERFLVLGQAEIYSATESGLFLELSNIGKSPEKLFRGKLEVPKYRRKETDPHLFGFICLLDSIYASGAWMRRDDLGNKFFQLTLLETKKPPVPQATYSKAIC